MNDKNIYHKDFKINFTDVGRDAKLNLTSAVNLAQDMTGQYFEALGSDNLTLRKKNNAAWVLTKTKMHFYSNPSWKDKIKCTSYTIEVRPARIELETLFKDENENILFIVRHEICPIDIKTRKIKKIKDITYPNDVKIYEKKLENTFIKLNETFKEKDKALEQKVYSTDIDFIGHVNNAVYVRYLMSTFSSDFIEKHEITDFEIHYLKECKENDSLIIYKKEYDKSIEFLIKTEKQDSIRAYLAYN